MDFRGIGGLMLGIWLITFAVGIAAVLQAGLNRLLGKDVSLASALFLNGAVFFTCSLVYWLWRKEEATSGSWAWWAFIPGILGFLFVLGVPFAISRLGATSVFVCLIAAQICGGLVWDWSVEGLPINLWKLVGAGLTLVGALVMTRG